MNLDSYISSQAVGKRSFTDRIKCPECDGLQWTWIDEVAAMRPPWSLDRLIRKPDIMTACDSIVKGRRNKESKHPTLMISYAELCPGDPAELCGAQQHRALSDAMAAAHVLRELIDRGAYPEVMP